MPRKGDSPQKRQDALIALSLARRGGGGLAGGLLIFPTIAALEAFNVAAPAVTPSGSVAIVLSNGSVWGLGVGTEGDADGITIATVTGGTPLQRWFRSNTNIFLPFYLAQTDWFVSSAGNDEAVGTDSGHPLKTNAELYRRWGYTWAPNLKGSGTITVHHLTPSTDGSDPSLYAPILEGGSTFLQIAPLPAAAFTGTLLAVTPKNKAANTPLESTFTTTTGAIVANMVLVNVTRGSSRSTAFRNLGGGNWILAQPLTPYAPGSGFPASSEVDTWANGDTIQGFVPINVDIAHVGAQPATFDGSLNPAHLVQDITIIDGNAGFGPLVVSSDLAAFEDCTVKRAMVTSISSTAVVLENVSTPASVQAFGVFINAGGIFGASGFQSTITSNGTSIVLFADSIAAGNTSLIDCGGIDVYIDTGQTIIVNTSVKIFGVNAIYGPGTANVVGGSLQVATSAVVNLPVANLRLDGAATGYSRVTVAGVTTMHGGVGLTAANIDAAAGPTGFGGFAEGPGCSIVVNGAQP